MSRARVVKPETLLPEAPEAIFLFRSCTGSLEYPGTENAIKEVMERLGVQVVMDPGQWKRMERDWMDQVLRGQIELGI